MGLPRAVGYVRRDISGASQAWHETQIRSLARRLGYDLTKTVVFNASTSAAVQRLINVVQELRIEAVLTPGLQHLGSGDVPKDLVAVVDVITVNPERTYARWPITESAAARSDEGRKRDLETET
ncbi:hypothetical protein [Nocardia asiatica]|uniref:hypothetical protein n=1 Tax=Nocardia asiatica TaxID=209252 RepID=UPI0002D47CAB|nr:hypothetical protein [Nocardia asiatica]